LANTINPAAAVSGQSNGLGREPEESKARLQAILDTAVDGIVTIDDKGIIESVNPALENMFGYRAEEITGKNVSLLMPLPFGEAHDGHIERYLDGGEPRIIGIGREVEGQRKDGTIFPVGITVSEVCVAGRRLFTGIIRDNSDRRMSEESTRLRLNELAHATRLLELGEMTSGIAHEVNQPLAAIVTFAEACLRMLKSGTADPQVLREALEQIAAQGERAGTIIHSLRQLSRKGATGVVAVDLNATVREVLNLTAHEARRNNVRVRLELEESLPPLPADKIQIEQVLLNLTRNAIEAMDETPPGRAELSISTRRNDSDEAEVSVRDSGKGLPAADADRVFETFYSTKSHGVGVGLSISRSIIEAHGGRLWASTNARGGTSFCFTLRLVRPSDDS